VSWVGRNIESVMVQEEKHRIIYINDASTDGTDGIIKIFFEESNNSILIRNEKNQGALSNYYRAIHECKDDEIIVALDGDDWLKHKNVLTELNKIYKNHDIWLTYGQYESSNSRKIGHCKAYSQECIAKNLFRESPWYASHLRTFYAGLFKRIKLKDLLYNGRFFPMTWDLAFMLPMLEMAGERHWFIKNTLYVYNTQNGQSDFRKGVDEQLYYHFVIANRRKYERLNEHFSKKDPIKKDFTRIILGEMSKKSTLKNSFPESCYLFPVCGALRKINLDNKKGFTKVSKDYSSRNLYHENNAYFRENMLKVFKEIITEWVIVDRDAKALKKEEQDWIFSELERTGCGSALVVSAIQKDDFCIVSPFFSDYETYVFDLRDLGKKRLYQNISKFICRKDVLLYVLEKTSFFVGFNALLAAIEKNIGREEEVALLFQF